MSRTPLTRAQLNSRYPNEALARILGCSNGPVYTYCVDYSAEDFCLSEDYSARSDSEDSESDEKKTLRFACYEVQALADSVLYGVGDNTRVTATELENAEAQKEIWDDELQSLVVNHLLVDAPRVDKYEQRRAIIPRYLSPPHILCNQQYGAKAEIWEFIQHVKQVVFKGDGSKGKANEFFTLNNLKNDRDEYSRMCNLYEKMMKKYGRFVVEQVVMYPPTNSEDTCKKKTGVYYRDVVFYYPFQQQVVFFPVYMSILNTAITTNIHSNHRGVELLSKTFLLSYDREEIEAVISAQEKNHPELYHAKVKAFENIGKGIEQYVMCFSPESLMQANHQLNLFLREIYPFSIKTPLDAYYAFFDYHLNRPSYGSVDNYFTVRRGIWSICEQRKTAVVNVIPQSSTENTSAIANTIFQYV